MACSGGCGVHAASVPAGCNARLAAAPAGRYTPAMKDGIETRLHVAAPLNQGAAVELDAGQAHYLRSVLRLAPGEAVALFNDRDGEWRARIGRLGKGEIGRASCMERVFQYV